MKRRPKRKRRKNACKKDYPVFKPATDVCCWNYKKIYKNILTKIDCDKIKLATKNK